MVCLHPSIPPPPHKLSRHSSNLRSWFSVCNDIFRRNVKKKKGVKYEITCGKINEERIWIQILAKYEINLQKSEQIMCVAFIKKLYILRWVPNKGIFVCIVNILYCIEIQYQLSVLYWYWSYFQKIAIPIPEQYKIRSCTEDQRIDWFRTI